VIKHKGKSKQLTPAAQHKRFLKAAKEADVDPAAFDAAFKRLDLRRKLPAEKKR
jgi:hypothetical protein